MNTAVIPSTASATLTRSKRPVLFPLGCKPLSDADVAKLAELKGGRGRAGGITSEDAASLGGLIEGITGIRIALIWDFNDMWGIGGNSEWAVVLANGQMREMPEGWFNFLWDGEEDVDIRELFARPAGAVFPRWQRLHEMDGHNFVRKNKPSEELG